jgi:hypothetical protein
MESVRNSAGANRTQSHFQTFLDRTSHEIGASNMHNRACHQIEENGNNSDK